MFMKDLHSRWTHRWVNPKVGAFHSPIHGVGLAAIAPIKKDEPVMALGGIAVPRSEILEYRKLMGHIGTQVHDDFFLVPTNRKEIEKTGAPNHSCNPNIGMQGSTVYAAIRNIRKGEELFLDYAFMESFFKPFKCKCGSKDCRAVRTPNDWKKKDLQRKYGRYFSPYLKNKIKIV